MSRLLVVVAQTDSQRYEWFKSVYADDPAVEIIFDRRQGERRQCDVSVPVDRRKHDRRTQDISYDLQRLGYVLVRRQDGPHPVSNPDSPEGTLRERLDSKGGLD